MKFRFLQGRYEPPRKLNRNKSNWRWILPVPAKVEESTEALPANSALHPFEAWSWSWHNMTEHSVKRKITEDKPNGLLPKLDRHS